MWRDITDQISLNRGRPFLVGEAQRISGGCINDCYVIADLADRYFIKFNRPGRLEMFVAEAAGLAAIDRTQTILVPQVVCSGLIPGHSYLVLNDLNLGNSCAAKWLQLGQQLAAMHQSIAPAQFGWHRHNYIGATPQLNDWSNDWAQFFIEQRLGYQFQLAGQRNFPQWERLLEIILKFLNHQPAVSLVHGDLWSGNAGFTKNGQPVIFDPAVYYADREVDLAMTELFGGFPAAFYQGYEEVYPLAVGYQQRKIIYNLYHILNHYNLFGGSYLNQANNSIAKILSWVP